MALSPKFLNDNEEVILDIHPHWWYLVPRAAALVGAMALGILALTSMDGGRWWETSGRAASGVLLVVVLSWFVLRVLHWRSTDFVVTSERCIFRTGVFRKSGVEIPLDRISTVFFNQSAFERILGQGDVGIESAGENSRQEFSDISDPAMVQRTIYQQMERYEERRQDRLGHVIRNGPGAEPAVPAAPPAPSIPDQIAQLDGLRQSGALTDEEFQLKKNELLGRM